jgi:mycofactocin precursor
MPDNPLTESADAPDDTQEVEAELPANDLVEEELLVEEISIDGMCGVY